MFERALDNGDMSDEFKNFMMEDLENVYTTLSEVKEDIDHIAISKRSIRKIHFLDKMIAFIYSTLVKFCKTNKIKGIPMSKNFIENLKGIMKNTTHIHHSHITDEIIGYAHSYYNQRVRENYPKITVVAHGLLRFDFFFLLNGLKAGVWRTRDTFIGGKNPTDMNSANIGNQVMFLDTIKYFQQSLRALANSLTDSEKSAISKECEKFIKKNENLARKFNSCTKEQQEWVLKYLPTGKGTIKYEMITRYDTLNISPEDGKFFLPHQSYSSLKDDIMTEEEYENVKKFYQTMKLNDLGQLNKFYNFQDTIMLCEVSEQRSMHLQKLFKYNPRKCNSASSFSGYVHKDKSKYCITLPTDAEHVTVFERTLIGGFSCVNT